MRACAAPAIVLSTLTALPALADIVPLARTTSLTASWYQSEPGGPSTGGNAADGTSNFAYYSNTISSGAGFASQTSYLLSNGAYASASGGGYQGTSVMHPSGASGNSTFTYVFNLTTPTLLYISGSLDRGSPFVAYGSIAIYNSTNTMVYHAIGAGGFTTTTPISDTYFAAVGAYRFVVSGGNNGASAGAPNGSSSASAFLTTPAPATATPLALGAAMARRRRR